MDNPQSAELREVLLKVLTNKENKMGYRSQVAYVIEFKKPHYNTPKEYAEEMRLEDEYAKNLFYTFIAESKARSETSKAWEDEVKDGKYISSGEEVKWGGALEVDYKMQIIKFRAEDVKWYDGYTDVDCHNAMISLAEEYISNEVNADNNNRNNEDYMSFTFVRIGEQSDDIEHKSGGTEETDNYIYPVSSIQWDMPEP
jgi:hypothetical protein